MEADDEPRLLRLAVDVELDAPVRGQGDRVPGPCEPEVGEVQVIVGVDVDRGEGSSAGCDCVVPRDGDEPASELLKKIAAEKAKLVKEGMIKKDKRLPEIAKMDARPAG